MLKVTSDDNHICLEREVFEGIIKIRNGEIRLDGLMDADQSDLYGLIWSLTKLKSDKPVLVHTCNYLLYLMNKRGRSPSEYKLLFDIHKKVKGNREVNIELTSISTDKTLRMLCEEAIESVYGKGILSNKKYGKG